MFVLDLCASPSGTTVDHNDIASKGTTWDEISTRAKAAQANGVKVCASLMSPNSTLMWNTIPDPEVFAKDVYSLIKQWGLDGIDIDPEQGNQAPSNGNFVQVVQALGRHFGPSAGTGLIMSYVTSILSNGEIILKNCAGLIDNVMTMGCFWPYGEMIRQFRKHAKIVGDSEGADRRLSDADVA